MKITIDFDHFDYNCDYNFDYITSVITFDDTLLPVKF